MSRTYLPLVKTSLGTTHAKILQSQDITWKRGWYNVIKGLTTGDSNRTNNFSIPYSAGNPLYNSFSPAISGGVVDINNVKNVDSFLCPYKVSGTISFNECLNFNVGNIYNTNIIKVRNSISREPFIYHPDSLHNYQIYLLYGYTNNSGSGIGAHCFYWVYFSEYGCTLISTGNTGIPGATDQFDIWIGVNTDMSNMPWDAGLVQDIGLYSQLQSPTNYLDFDKKTYTVANNSDMFTGLVPFATGFNCSILYNSKVILGFWNGIEVNCAIKDKDATDGDDDLVFDTESPNYPTSTDIYWNGTARGSSNLGNIKANDVFRIYYEKAL
jgi:hypothetical protein